MARPELLRRMQQAYLPTASTQATQYGAGPGQDTARQRDTSLSLDGHGDHLDGGDGVVVSVAFRPYRKEKDGSASTANIKTFLGVVPR
jgi:hypothetical protein